MIEDLLINKLADCLGLPVYAEIPKNPPSEFYVIEKTGGALVNHIKSATLAIQSYSATSKFSAASMNDDLKDVMLDDIYEMPEITDVELNSDYDYTDTAQKLYRYQAVFDIKYY